jgi:hypothetical protein
VPGGTHPPRQRSVRTKNGRLHYRRHLRAGLLFVIPLLPCTVMIPPVSSLPTCVLACQERAWVADLRAVETITVASRYRSLLPVRRLPAASVLWRGGVTPRDSAPWVGIQVVLPRQGHRGDIYEKAG